jgi:uncharacterized protein
MSTFVAALVVLLALYNNVLNLIPHDTFYVPLNFGVAVLLVLAARRAGLGLNEIGLGRDGIGPGLRWGGLTVLVIALGLLVVFAVPFLRPLLDDQRAAMSGGMVAYHVLVRIPLGTVVLEEVAFRGVLLAAWERVSGWRVAVVGSCVVFGLWHIVPALELVRINELASTVAGQAGLVAIAVVATGVGGGVLVAFRVWTKGLWGPAVVHAGANSLALLVASSAQ